MEGHVVFICLHPNERFHLEIMSQVSERFIFVREGTLTHIDDWSRLMALDPVRAYLGSLAQPFDGAGADATVPLSVQAPS